MVDKLKQAGVEQVGFAYVLPKEKRSAVNDPVARVLAERERLDAGFPGERHALSIVGHLLLIGGGGRAASLCCRASPP